MIREIEYPFTQAKIRELKLGETVSISGCIFTGRDMLHKYLFEDGKAPVDLRDGAIYHCGPIVMRREGAWHVSVAGPTTSIRQEPYMPKVIEKHRVRVIIGKGGMGRETAKAFAKYGCVYLQVAGGAAALLAEAIDKVNGVYFLKEFGPTDALWEFSVKKLAAVVTMDAYGRSLYDRVKSRSKRVLKGIITGEGIKPARRKYAHGVRKAAGKHGKK